MALQSSCFIHYITTIQWVSVGNPRRPDMVDGLLSGRCRAHQHPGVGLEHREPGSKIRCAVVNRRAVDLRTEKGASQLGDELLFGGFDPSDFFNPNSRLNAARRVVEEWRAGPVAGER